MIKAEITVGTCYGDVVIPVEMVWNHLPKSVMADRIKTLLQLFSYPIYGKYTSKKIQTKIEKRFCLRKTTSKYKSRFLNSTFPQQIKTSS